MLAERRARAARMGRAALTCMLVLGSTVVVGAQPSGSVAGSLRATTGQAADPGLAPTIAAPSHTQPFSTRHDRSGSTDLADDAYRPSAGGPSQAASSFADPSVRISDYPDTPPARAPPTRGSI